MPEQDLDLITPITIWSVANMERKLPDGNVPPEGQVYTLHYTVTHYDQGESVGAYGSLGLSDPDPDNYTPYDQITKEIAVQWLKNVLGEDRVQEIEVSLEQQLKEKLNPTKAAGVPW